MNANNNNQANGTKNCQSSFDEAPAGWNTRYLDPNGFECQITIRVKNDSELLEITANAIAYLLAKTCTPSVCCRNGARPIDSKSIEQKKKNEGENNGNGNKDHGSSPSWRSAFLFSPGLIRILLASFNKAPLKNPSAQYF
jgi:hypothetical protein